MALVLRLTLELGGVSRKNGKEVGKSIQLSSIDSYRLMPFSLDKMASSLHDDQCKHLKKIY